MTTKRTLVFAGCLAALLSTALVAQHGPGGGHFKMRHGGDHADMADMMAEHLGLNASQKATLTQLHKETEAKAAPLMEQRHALMQQNHEALEAGNADATEIGTRTIAAWELGQQIRALHEEAMGKLSAVLNAEQKAKLEEIKVRHWGHHGEED
jgi:Spy/CpxP family protein refolding chaperone